MAKSKTVFFCSNCGAESSKWIGKCPSCQQWNTYTEETVSKEPAHRLDAEFKTKQTKPVEIHKLENVSFERIRSGIVSVDHLLGGGIVPGSLILLGGDPGIGKSTLALQVALAFAKQVLYVSGEESTNQIKMRADRIGGKNEACKVYGETRLELISKQIKELTPDLVIIDSIQTIYSNTIESAPGSISQVRDCAAKLLQIAKESNIPIILIGHITKEGSLAGPKILEHIVDVVVQFEGDKHLTYRMLRSLKNRFGSVPELALFEMQEKGLKEIDNPSELLISHSGDELSGVAIASTIDGSRPFLLEIQALAGPAVYGTPQRTANGIDNRRLNMLLAVLEKKSGFNLSSKDIFINLAGGLKIQDTSIDLAVIAAIVSSYLDKSVDARTMLCAEVSLTGELRPVSKLEARLAEAEKIGFNTAIVPAFYSNSLKKTGKLKIQFAATIPEALKKLFTE